MGRFFSWALFLIAAAAFTVGLVVHVATYFDLALTERWPLVWGAYGVGFLLFAYCVVDAKARTGTRRKAPFFTAFDPSAQTVAEFAARILLFYSLTVFAIGFFQSREGNLNRVDGRPVLTRQGKVIRELTESEHAHLKASEMRGMTAIMLTFLATGALELFSLVLLEKKKPSVP